VILQPYDMEVGAGTFHPATTLRALARSAGCGLCAAVPAPKDGATARTRTGCSTTISFQVILKPSPFDIQELYLKSLAAIGIDSKLHDIRFVEDDWESPTLAPGGLAGSAGATAWSLAVHLLPAGRGLRMRAGRG